MSVAVIIAAYDSSATIARAIRSALAQPEVAEVIVIDDGSSDDTAAAALAAGAGDGRLHVERLPVNRGPSAARNRALEIATADHVAILDADDMLLPGRFARLFGVPEWDIIADNILFVTDGIDPTALQIPQMEARTRSVNLAGFIDGCVQRRSRSRSQLGFLKPVMRRAMIADYRLRYDEKVRLGEDFLFYVELLRRGARFVLTSAPGYVAVERATSLTSRHRTADLAALLDAERAALSALPPASGQAASMRRRIADTAAKHALRAFLDAKRSGGLAEGLRWLSVRPDSWRAVVNGVARDKADAVRARLFGPPRLTTPRLLLPIADRRPDNAPVLR